MVNFNEFEDDTQVNDRPSLIPDGTVVPVLVEIDRNNTIPEPVTINGETYPANLLRKSQNGGMHYIAVAYKITGGEYFKRIIWDNLNIACSGEVTDGQQKGIKFAHQKIKGLIQSHCGLSSTDKSEKAQNILANFIPGNDYFKLEGINAVVRIDFREGEMYKDKATGEMVKGKDKNSVAPWGVLRADDGQDYTNLTEFFQNKPAAVQQPVSAPSPQPTFSPDTDRVESEKQSVATDLPNWG